jgi:ribosomal protein S4
MPVCVLWSICKVYKGLWSLRPHRAAEASKLRAEDLVLNVFASFLLEGRYHFGHEARGPAQIEGVLSAILESRRDHVVYRCTFSSSDKR